MRQHIEFVSRDRTGITSVVTINGVTDVHAAVTEIRSGRTCFVAGPSSWDLTEVSTRDALGGSYLYANWDGTKRNNLHDLAGPAPFQPAGREPSRMMRAYRSVLRIISIGAPKSLT